MSSRLHLIAVIAALSVAQARAADNLSSYLISAQDRAPVTSGYGGCVQTSQWTPDASHFQCNPQPVAMHVSAFDFDSALLRADAGPALDQLAKQLTQANYQTVHVVGHADRIGPAKYNQQLSEQRAEAVRDYLVAHGIDGSRIAVSGAGSAKPVTGSQCTGLEGEPLISCLQRDRYAEVRVTGMQTSAMR